MIQHGFCRVLGRIRIPLCCLLLVTAAAAQGPNPPASGDDKSAINRHSLSPEDFRLLLEARALTPEMIRDLPTARVHAMLLRLKQPSPTSAIAAAQYAAMVRSGGTDVAPKADALQTALRQAQVLADRADGLAARPAGDTTGSAAAQVLSVAGLPVGTRAAPPAASPGIGKAASKLPPDYEPMLPSARFKPRPEGDASPRAWKWLGPLNIGGRTRAIIVNPKAPNVMWAAGVTGGIWKSQDAGASWQPLPGFVAAIPVSALAIDPKDPDTLFAGTGEGFLQIAPDRGLGIFRSTDGGNSWVALPDTADASGGYVNKLAFTSDGAALLVASRAGLLRSLTFRQAAAGDVKFFRVAPGDGLGFANVTCSPRDATRCVAGAYRARALVSRDGGANWAAASGPAALPTEQPQAGRVELAFAAADPMVVYAGIDVASGEVWRSSDGGSTFARRSTSSRYLGNQGMHANSIWAGDPLLADLVVVGGVDMFRSTDGGTTLTRVSDWRQAPRSAAANQHAIVPHPDYNGSTNRTIYVCNDGGIFRHDDALNATAELGWMSLNNAYGTGQFHSVAGNPESGRIVGGAQDSGVVSYEPPPVTGAAGPTTFRTMVAGDGTSVAADPDNINVVYGSQAWLWLSRSTTGGLSAEPIFEGIAEAGPTGGTLYVAPIVLDPAETATMLVGGVSLWRSQDVKSTRPTWIRIKAPLVSKATPPSPAPISAVEFRPSVADKPGPAMAWIGHTNGDLYRSPDVRADQPTWSPAVQGASILPRRLITRIRAFHNPGADAGLTTLIIALGGFFPDNLWQSDDDGRSWRNIHGDLPTVPVFDIARHPRNPMWMFAATEIGVFASIDGGRNWTPTSSGPSLVRATQMLWMGERLVVSTFGRGLYWIDLSGLDVRASGTAGSPPALPTPEPAPAAATPR